MLVTGACDKNSAAIKLLVQQEVDAIIGLKNHFQGALLLEEFFKSKHFVRPYPDDCDLINHQAFLMALIPHVSVCAESRAAKNEKSALECIQFINSSRKEQVISICQEAGVNLLTFFFRDIEQEINFCNSQVSGLEFVSKALSVTHFSARPREIVEQLITPRASTIDAKNLTHFSEFHNKLDLSHQDKLARELLYAVVIQMGWLEAVKSGIKTHVETEEKSNHYSINRKDLVFSSKTTINPHSQASVSDLAQSLNSGH